MRGEVGGSSPPSRATESDRLYVIGRADLAPGLRAAQLGHACIAWTVAHGPPPENLVLLEVADLGALLDLQGELGHLDPEGHVRFHEPDLGGELTALATAHPEARRALSSLPLAMRSTERETA